MATSPDCDYEEIDTDDLDEGDALSCPECGRKLVLVRGDGGPGVRRRGRTTSTTTMTRTKRKKKRGRRRR
jgi:ssDNA-binding Zn-finger/Zn-ribbon topoisomerase 1